MQKAVNGTSKFCHRLLKTYFYNRIEQVEYHYLEDKQRTYAMENKRKGDPFDSYHNRLFNNDRFFRTNDGWFYEARFMVPVGPFHTKEIAVENCTKRYITKNVNFPTF